jgi:hypothetical protein
MSDCNCVAAAGDVAVAGDDVLVAELGELLQADATRPIAIAAAAKV